MLAAAGQAFQGAVHAAVPRRAVQMRGLHHRAPRSADRRDRMGVQLFRRSGPTGSRPRSNGSAGLALVVGSIFLIPPVTSLMAGLYLDDIAGAGRAHRTSRPTRPAASCRRSAAIGAGAEILRRRAGGEPRRAVPAARARRQPDRLLCRQRLSAGARIFRAGRHAASAAGGGEAAAEGATGSPCLLCGLVIAGLASVPILNLLDAALRHRLHGAHLQGARAPRRRAAGAAPRGLAFRSEGTPGGRGIEEKASHQNEGGFLHRTLSGIGCHLDR